MVFGEHKTELVYFLPITEETEVLVNEVGDYVWEAKDERKGSLIEVVESWHWICL